jgi:NAD(P)-dependent dehydrogenase (short-subunit alcohol dehydrogenase family)
MIKPIVLITGATSGIGKQTAYQLAEKGLRIFIVGRDEEACRGVVNSLRPVESGDHGYFVCDLSSMAQINILAGEIHNRLPCLNVLINNAGCVNSSRTLTDEGLERTFAVNHMSYFYLTNQLLPLLRVQPGARIVSVASDSHYYGKLEFDNLQGERNYFIMNQYSNTKLMNVLFTMEIARRLQDDKITANCLHPGVVKTRIGNKHTGFFMASLWEFFTALRGISEEQGAKTSVYLASSEQVESVTGKYFSESKVKEPLKIAYDTSLSEKLWRYSEELLKNIGLNYNEI